MLKGILPLVARFERTVMRRMPARWVVQGNAALHQRIGEPELHLLERYVEPGSVAVDVGGHFGVYSLALARLVGPAGQVITIEPIVEDARMISRAARTMGLPIRVMPCAASDVNGEADLHVPLVGGAQKTALSTLEDVPHSGEIRGEGTRTVPTRTLDDILSAVPGRVSFLKIDVEGHELAVLDGAREVLSRFRPSLMVEINDDDGDRSATETIGAIERMGYRGEFYEHGEVVRPVREFDARKHQHASAGNPLSKSYVNNFFFVPADR